MIWLGTDDMVENINKSFSILTNTSAYNESLKTIYVKKGLQWLNVLKNAINDELNQPYQIRMNFDHEEETNRWKNLLTSFPTRFVGNDILHFQQKLVGKQREYELVIPDLLFAEANKFNTAEIPHCLP